MFKSSVTQTPFTTDAANAYFTNITGGSFGYDRTFLATLRALLAPRMQEGESINLIFGASNITSSQVGSNSVRAVVTSICGSYYLDTPGQIIIHSLKADQASNMACFKVIESDFTSIYEGYHRLDKLQVFYRKSFTVDCYINPDLKSVIVFVDGLDNKKMHYLQVSILAMLPWYFDPAKGMTEDEMALVYSLRETSPDKYNECLAKIVEQYDFKSARIRQLLAGFETRYERLECDRVRNEITHIDANIESYNQQIGEYLKQRNEKCIRLMGLETKIASNDDGDSEIMEYFIRNPNLVLEDVSDSDMYFCTKGYLEYYDPDMAERAIRNKRSFAYKYGFASHEQNIEKAQRLLSEIFLEENPRLRIRFCAAYRFSLNGSVRAMDGHDFGYELTGYMPNTHINDFRCLGDYNTAINTLLQRRDYIGALEQCIASCKSLNWNDGPVMEKFMQKFWANNGAPRCIELPDGKVVNAKEAIQWLEEQDKPAETEAAPVEEAKEETQDEQAD